MAYPHCLGGENRWRNGLVLKDFDATKLSTIKYSICSLLPLFVLLTYLYLLEIDDGDFHHDDEWYVDNNYHYDGDVNSGLL